MYVKRVRLFLILLGFIIVSCGSPASVTESSLQDENETNTEASSGEENDTNGETFTIQPNLASGKPVTASGSVPGNPPEFAVDGEIGYSNTWSSDGGYPQWIEIDLGSPARIDSIQLLLSQPQTALSTHKVWGMRTFRGTQLLHEFTGITSNNQLLSYTFPSPVVGIHYIKVETIETPSSAAWQEIQVFGQAIEESVLTAGSGSIIFYNGNVITMEGDMEVAQAIAIQDEIILGVGTNEDILALQGEETVVVDLQGKTIMPGFVDTHSHLLSNWRDDLIGVQEFILSRGITTYTEMGADEDMMREITMLDRGGNLRLRVSLYPLHVNNCGDIWGAWYLEDYPVSLDPGAFLQIPGVKMFNDGGSCNGVAVSYNADGILDGVGSGDLYFSVEELTSLIVEVQNNGYQVAIHGLGDRAIEVNQDAIEAALAGGPNTHRHRIEHNALLRDDLLPRYTEIDIVAMIFGYFPTCSFIEGGRFAESTPDEFRVWEWRWRALLDANPDAHIVWHADAPVPALGPLDPILHLYGYVTRKQVRDDGFICEPPDWAADDVLTIEEALPLMTIEAAYAIFREDDIGSLRAGKYADVIILSENPLTIDPNSILDIEVWMTMVNGQVEYCAAGHDEFCP